MLSPVDRSPSQSRITASPRQSPGERGAVTEARGCPGERHLAQELDLAGYGSRGVANTLADVVDRRRPLREIGSEFGERDQDDDRLAVGFDAACVRRARLAPGRQERER